jgi:hypothetical protein
MKLDAAAIKIKMMETTRPKIPAAALLYLNIYATRINPLKPRKSTIDMTISTTMIKGCMYIYKLKCDFFLHKPLKPKY